MSAFTSSLKRGSARHGRGEGWTGVWQSLVGVLRMGLDLVVHWQRQDRDRRRLASMDARQLQDLGISAADAQIEAGKPFWRD